MELCQRLYADTIKMTEKELSKCETLVNSLGRFLSQALKKHDEAKNKVLKKKFSEFNSLNYKTNSHLNSQATVGSLCRDLRENDKTNELYFPTEDNQIKSAVPDLRSDVFNESLGVNSVGT